MEHQTDTIAAIATAPGRGGVGIVRVSGPKAATIAEAVLGKVEIHLAVARRRLRSELGDEGLVDASAVIANYNALDRVADATGIPLEAAKEANTVELRAVLGINDFA